MSTDIDEQLIGQLVLTDESVTTSIGAIIKSVTATDRLDEFQRAVKRFSDQRSVEIANICNSKYHQFFMSLQWQQTFRDEVAGMLEKVESLKDIINSSADVLLAKKLTRLELLNTQRNLERCIEGCKDSLRAFNLAQMAALHILDQLWIPNQLARIKDYATEQLNQWMSLVKENSQNIGELEDTVIRLLYEEHVSSSTARISEGDTTQLMFDVLLIERLGNRNVFDDPKVKNSQLNFQKLQKAAHLFDLMDRSGTFCELFRENMKRQSDFMSAFPLDCTDQYSGSILYLHRMLGFILIKRHINTILPSVDSFEMTSLSSFVPSLRANIFKYLDDPDVEITKIQTILECLGRFLQSVKLRFGEECILFEPILALSLDVFYRYQDIIVLDYQERSFKLCNEGQVELFVELLIKFILEYFRGLSTIPADFSGMFDICKSLLIDKFIDCCLIQSIVESEDLKLLGRIEVLSNSISKVESALAFHASLYSLNNNHKLPIADKIKSCRYKLEKNLLQSSKEEVEEIFKLHKQLEYLPSEQKSVAGYLIKDLIEYIVSVHESYWGEIESESALLLKMSMLRFVGTKLVDIFTVQKFNMQFAICFKEELEVLIMYVGKLNAQYSDCFGEITQYIESAPVENVSMVAIATNDESFTTEREDRQQLLQTMELEVAGMTCVACASAIKDCLSKEHGVEGIEVYLESDTASVCYDPSVVSQDDILHRIEAVGFSAKIAGADSVGQNKGVGIKTIISAFFGILELVICMCFMHTSWYQQRLIGQLQFGVVLETIIGSASIFTVGSDIIRKAFRSIKKGQPGMDLLVSLGILVSFVYSMVNVLLLMLHSPFGGATVFETVTTLIMSTSVGKFLELKAKKRCSRYLRNLEKVFPKYSVKVDNGHFVTVQTSKIAKGDRVFTLANERISVDGICIDDCLVDEALMTGESEPVQKKIGDCLYAGSITLSDVTLICTGTGKATLLGQIAKSMRANSERKPKLQAASDILAKYFVAFILIYTGFTLLFWTLLGYSGHAPSAFYQMGSSVIVIATRIAVTVLTIACPCALGLAAPMAIVVGKGRAAKRGIIISNSQAIDNCRLITTVAFDKTGTLTIGRPEVIEFRHVDKTVSVEHIWAICAKAEMKSTHLIGRAIRAFCGEEINDYTNTVAGIRQVDGGLVCYAKGEQVMIGSSKLMESNNVKTQMNDFTSYHERLGRTTIYVSIASSIVAIFIIGDQLRSDALSTIQDIRSEGKNVCIISGDTRPSTRYIADQIGVQEYYYQKSPFEKAELISTRQELGERVCFVGDGINDSPAMGLTCVSIAMGTATDLTSNSADIVLLRPSLSNVKAAIAFCNSIRRKVIVNFICAASYNIIAIPLASGLLLKYGVYVSPTYSGIFMATSSLLVLINSILF